MPAGRRTVTTQLMPTVPTSAVSVELSDLRRRGAPLAVLVAQAADDDAPWFGPGAQWLADDWRAAIGATGRAGEVWTVPEPATGSNVVRWLAGIGGRAVADWRSAGAALIRSIQDFPVADRRARSVDVALPADVEPAELGAFVLGLRLGGYRFRVTGDRSDDNRVRTIRLCLQSPPADELATELARAVALSSATVLARDLANTPSNVKDPAWLAGVVTRVTAGTPGLTVTVRDEAVARGAGFRRRARGRRRFGQPAAAGRTGLAAAWCRPCAAPGAGRQGRHVRHRWRVAQAGRRHAPDAHRHVRCRGRDRGRARDRRTAAAGAGHRTGSAGREPPVRIVLPARRHRAALRRPHHRGDQHRRRGPDAAGRRHRLRRAQRCARTCWSTSPR